jgi:hypothetical protein
VPDLQKKRVVEIGTDPSAINPDLRRMTPEGLKTVWPKAEIGVQCAYLMADSWRKANNANKILLSAEL